MISANDPFVGKIANRGILRDDVVKRLHVPVRNIFQVNFCWAGADAIGDGANRRATLSGNDGGRVMAERRGAASP